MKQKSPTDKLNVFISNRESICDECKTDLGHHAWITLREGIGALCLSCADLDHLVFLPTGDASLTRRARKHSKLVAIVLKWSRTRKQYERQGILVEQEALEKAEQECLADGEARARRRKRNAEKQMLLDREYVERFACRIRELFPGCPPGREINIAEHACLKYSGRVGRSAAAKSLHEEAVRIAVIAHIRHTETRYDDYLSRGFERDDARDMVAEKTGEILSKWNIQT